MASPAMAFGPETGDQLRQLHQPSGTPQYDGTNNPGTPPQYDGANNPGSDRSQEGQARRPVSTPSPRSKRALGVVCRAEGVSRSNENDPEPGTPFSRCVRTLAQANKKACEGEPKQRPEGDTERGTPFSRCVSDLAQGLRASTRKTNSDRRQARIACKRPDFDSGREFSRCVRIEARALRTV